MGEGDVAELVDEAANLCLGSKLLILLPREPG
jgi:hypothetical protein